MLVPDSEVVLASVRPARIDASLQDRPARKIEVINVLLVGVVFAVVFLSYFVNHRIAAMHTRSMEVTQQSTQALSTLVGLTTHLEAASESIRQLRAGEANMAAAASLLLHATDAIEDLLHRLESVNSPFPEAIQTPEAAEGVQALRTEGGQILLKAREFQAAPASMAASGREFIERAESLMAKLVVQHARVLVTLEAMAKVERDESNNLLIVQYGVLVAVPPLIAMFLFYQMLLASRSEKLERERIWYLAALEAKQAELESQQEELAHARDDAIRTSQAKSAFVANMSHEIRTPLTAIIGFSDILLVQSGPTSENFDSLSMISLSAKHLLQIINDILDLSKIEADKLQIDPTEVSVFSIVDDVIRLCALQAELKGLVLTTQFEFPMPSAVKTDALRLKQILLNLTNNAIKFTERGGVTVFCGYSHESSEVWFEIKDTGIGLSAEQIVRLFTAFSQADTSTTRRFGGTGLGLYLSRRLVSLLDGELTVASVPGQGSTFRFTAKAVQVAGSDSVFRLTTIPGSERPAPAAAVQTFSGCGQVLLVEDNPINQKLIGFYLKRLGLSFDTADNGRQAFDMALAKRYALVLMDIQMPEMDGYEATNQLRLRGYTGPIVALTANAMTEDIEKAKGAGCDDVLIKPIDQKEFARVFAEFVMNQADSTG